MNCREIDIFSPPPGPHPIPRGGGGGVRGENFKVSPGNAMNCRENQYFLLAPVPPPHGGGGGGVGVNISKKLSIKI